MFKPTIPHLAAGLAAAAALLAAGPAQASDDQHVAMSPDGRAHYAFKLHANGVLQVHERQIDTSGALGDAQSVSWAFRPAISQHVGVDDAGNAVIAWTSSDGPDLQPAYIRRRTSDGALSATQKLTPQGVTAQEMELAVEPDGDAIAVWSRGLDGKHVVQARRRAADGTLGPLQTLSATTRFSYGPQVAVAPDGTATVVWKRADPDEHFVQARTIAPDNSLSTVQRLSGDVGSAYGLWVTVSDTGTAVAGWNRSLAAGGHAIESRARSATGALGAVQTIAGPDDFTSSGDQAGNGAGRVVYSWRKQLPDSTSVVKGRVRQPNGTLGPIFEVSDGQGTEPKVAIDPDGVATFVWTVPASTRVIQLRRRDPNGQMGSLRTVSDPARDASGPHVAVDPAGRAAVSWYAPGATMGARTVAYGGAMSPVHLLGPAAL
ncbi:MAG TPA: hypothetical protein VF533_12430 [Solirubrobacteraceae bacterium]